MINNKRQDDTPILIAILTPNRTYPKRVKFRIPAESQERVSSCLIFREPCHVSEISRKMRGKRDFAYGRAVRLTIAKETEPGVDTPKHIVVPEKSRMNRRFEEFANIITSRKFIEPTRDHESPKFREFRTK